MATRTDVRLVDDLDGSAIQPGLGETVRFALDGISYEIDLTDTHAEGLRAALTPYTGKARRIGRKTGTSGGRTQVTDPREVRDWARSNGWPEISDRGRVPAEVQLAWDTR